MSKNEKLVNANERQTIISELRDYIQSENLCCVCQSINCMKHSSENVLGSVQNECRQLNKAISDMSELFSQLSLE